MATQYFNKFNSYCRMIKDAKDVAKRSVLVDHCGSQHIDLNLGNVDCVYQVDRDSKRGSTRLSLIEFKRIEDAEKVAKQAHYRDGSLPIPLKFFQYRGPNITKANHPVKQAKLAYTSDKMSLIGLKLRFITLVNFERILCSGLFEEYELMPYGSSVSHFGCDAGDLDLLMTRKIDHESMMTRSLSTEPPLIKNLCHLNHEQRESNDIKGPMRLFDHILRQYMPLVSSHTVMSVPHAKVPIIKFTSRLTRIDCDLSFNLGLEEGSQTYSGIQMSHLLYNLCQHNNLFTGIVAYLRRFGKMTGITGKGGTVKFTNFQFLSLIIFYLQQEIDVEIEQTRTTRRPILPPFRRLLQPDFNFKPWTISMTDEQLDHNIPRIVKGFFEYYSNFDYDKKSMNLLESRLERKPDNSTIYVVNPIERTRNVCYNVTSRGCDHFVKQIRAALVTTSSGETTYSDLINQLWSDNNIQIKI